MTEERSQSALFGSLSKELLAGGMGFRFQARGRSMAPSIWDGETVHVQPVAVETLRKGDIVLFSDGAHFRAHRLLKAGPEAFVTQGDAALESDGIVRPEQILGKVIAKEESADGVTRVVKLGAAPGRRYRVRRAFAGLASRVVGVPSKLENRLFARGISRLGKLLVVLFSLALALPALGQVAFDAASSGTASLTGAAPSLTFTHTTSGTNTLLLVGVSLNISGNTGANVSGITYNGTPLTLVGAHNDAGNTRRVEIWSLVGPATGTGNSIVTSFFLPGGTGTVGAVVGANTFTGVDQYQPLRTFVSADGGATSTYSQLDIPSGINEYAMDVLAVAGTVTITGYTTGHNVVPDTMEWNAKSGANATDVSGSSATHAGTTSVPMAETFAASTWSVAGISVKPVQSDIGVSVTSTSAQYVVNSTTLTYNLTVTNYGPTPATNVTLTDTLATGLTNVQFSSSQTSCSGTYPTYTCAIGNLATNASVQVVVTATPSASGSYTNTASVTATQPDYNTLNNSATAIANAVAISCAGSTAPTNSGTLTGVINTYYPGNGTAPAGATSIPVLAATSGGGGGIATGDILLVIQMQGASINASNSSSYGNGASGAGYTNLNNTGNYEYVTAGTITGTFLGPGSILIKGDGPGGGLLFSYTSSAATTTQGQSTFQVVRVPQYSTATLSSTLTALPWNGTAGGILAVDVAGTLTLGGAAVSLDGFGFRGAAGLQLAGNDGTILPTPTNGDFVSMSPPATYVLQTNGSDVGATPGAGGGKGEGIAGTPMWVQAGISGMGVTTIAGGGAGYHVGDVLSVTEAGGSGGQVIVTSVSGANAVTGLVVIAPGTGYSVSAAALTTTAVTGTGSGATVNITVIGEVRTGTDYPSAASGLSNGGMARGAPGTAGGGGTDGDPNGAFAGGNDENSGGGGGGNGGGGGAGGDSWNSTLGVGGLAGSAFPASMNSIVMGGGGGSGTRNNSSDNSNGATSPTQASGGAAGGGIVMIRTGALTGSGTITANGLAAFNNTANDAGGGGGAGGSIIVLSSSGGESGLTVNAYGGRGGDAWDTQAFALINRHGPGGGGGGGVVLISGAAASYNVNGGANGITLASVPYGSTIGSPGIYVTNASARQSSAAPGGMQCLPDLTIAKSHSGAFVQGQSGSYTLVASNVSLYGTTSGTVSVTDTMPTGLTPTAASGSTWSCQAPSGQSVTCTNANALSPGASYPAITVTASVASNATSPLTNTATVSGGGEVNTANDSASDLTYIVSASGSADLSITTSATSGTSVYAGNNITLVHTITNGGPAVSDITFTEAVPANSTFQYVIPPAGWTCTTPAVGATGTISCTNPSVAVNTPVNITVAFNTNANTPNLTNITATASVGAATTHDPNLANNTASVTTLVNTGVNLTVTNTGTPSPVVTGGTITYTQPVVNNGPSAAPNVVFTETIPANSTFSSMGALPAGWSCSTPAVGSTGTTITCNVSSMAPGNTAIFTVVLNATGAGGTVVTDSISAFPTPTSMETSPQDNSATSTISIGAANQVDLGVTIANPANPIVAGTNIAYTFTVTNYGPATVTNATLTVPTPTNTTKVSLTGPTGWTCATTCTLTTGTLAENATATFTLTVTVGAAVTAGTVITDTANIATTQNDTNSANNTATVTNTVGATANLAMTNTSTPPAVVVSNNITYTQQLTNSGPNAITANTANGVTYTVTIQIPTGTNYQSITVPNHWTCTPPAVGTVGPTTFPCTLNNGSSLAANASVTFSPVLQVNAGVANGTIINETVSVASCGTAACLETTPGNNSATATNTVVTANTEADLAVTNTPSVTTIAAGEPITYTQVLTNNGPHSAANPVTFTEVIPTNTTFQSVTISGVTTNWTCPAPSGTPLTLTCTKTSTLASLASTTFTVVVQVNAGTAAGTIITDAASATSATADPTSINNTNITATTTVAGTGSADVSVNMTGTPSSVSQGDTLTYTLTVNNGGPNTATNVTLTDPLPSGVTYASVSTTAGTCSQASGTVTCLLGTMSNGGFATVTLLAAAGAPNTVTNTASVTADQNDPNTSNNSSSVTTAIASPTKVTLRWFKAGYSGSDVVLQWRTGGEAHNLGFNVYREQNGERIRLNPALIAGSALRMRDASSAHSAKTYAWVDHQPASAGSVYWLEDVDLNGTRTFHGTSYVQAQSDVKVVSRARMVTELRAAGASNESPILAGRRNAEKAFVPSPSTAQQQQTQFTLAAKPGMKIQVQQEGWYQITQAQLAAAGLTVAQLGGARLYAEGVEQPIKVSSSGMQLEFYGTGIDTVSSNLRVYWLDVNGGSGKRILPISGVGRGGAQPQSFPYAVELKDRTTYFAALLTSDGNNFFGAPVTTTPVDQVLAVQDVATTAADPAQLEVFLQGVVADTPHDVVVSLNGVTVGEITFNGQNVGKLDIEVPVNLLVAGNNTVTLTAQDGDDDISLVEHITLTYPHSYTAESDALKFTAAPGDHIRVQGFTNTPSRLMDITDPANPIEVVARVVAQPAGFALDVLVPAELSGTRTFLAVAADAMASPVALVYNQPSNWHASQAGAQVVMITDPAFVSQLTPLVNLRRSQGWSVAVVQTDDIFDEFNFGERSPQAIRDFLQNSTTQWQTPPQYVLLVGDASVDPNNYLGFGYFDFVPTKIIATSELMTACDDWFTEFANDGIAQIPTGRLPVRTASDAALVVGKIVGYENNTASGTWMNQALLVADQDDTESFTNDTLSVAALLPASMQVTEVLASTMDAGTASQQILAAINSGQLLVNYLGHGSVEVWSGEDLFDNDAAASLTNSNLSVFLLMDCLNGFFHDVYTESLAEALLLSPNGGAVAVWASSGLNNPPPQLQMDQQLIRALVANPGIALGDAVQQGKMNITDPDARQTYILFGDPLLHLKSMSAAPVPAPQPHRPVPVRQPLR